MLFNMHRIKLAAAMMATAAIAGCSQDVDQGDVNAAQEKLQQERQETEEVRREVQQQVAKENQETEATRHETMKPTSKEVREEENESAEAQLEGNAKIEKEEQETREAEEELAITKAKLNAQKARDAFLEGPNDVLEKAALRIDTLQKQADSEEGATKKATEKQIETLQAAHDELEELIDDMKSANPLKWEETKPKVEVAQANLQKLLNEAKID